MSISCENKKFMMHTNSFLALQRVKCELSIHQVDLILVVATFSKILFPFPFFWGISCPPIQIWDKQRINSFDLKECTEIMTK